MSAADADRKPPNVRCILQVEVVGSEADQARRGTDGLAVLATPHQVRQPHLLGIGAPVQHHNVFWFGHKPSKRALCQPAYRSFNTCRLCPHTLSQTLPDPLPALAQQDHAGVLQEPLYEFLHHGLRDHRTRSRLHIPDSPAQERHKYPVPSRATTPRRMISTRASAPLDRFSACHFSIAACTASPVKLGSNSLRVPPPAHSAAAAMSSEAIYVLSPISYAPDLPATSRRGSACASVIRVT